MSKYILVNIGNETQFMRETCGADAYTDDIGLAKTYETKYGALRERIDDEQVARLLYEEGSDGIEGYEILNLPGEVDHE